MQKLDLFAHEHTREFSHVETKTHHFQSSGVPCMGFSSVVSCNHTSDTLMSADSYLPSFRLDGKVALVTGSSRGIGFGLAKALAEFGAKVAIAARDRHALTELAKTIPDCLPIPMDMRSITSIREGILQAETHFGRLDVLVNNAGIGANHPALNVTESDWDEIMDVNLKGLFFCAQAAARGMISRGFGRIINISSQAGVVGIVDHAVYCASKGGVNQLTRVMALEWSKFGVTVNAVGPTFIYTPGTAERLDNPIYRENVLRRIPAGKIGDISDVSGAVIYLASDAAKLVSGTCLLVDGGWTAQ
jgi:NAD(P)-dependent dehydrogenase (short-subunit alcohol dehydrogenase family)